jgi:hypothetical protein
MNERDFVYWLQGFFELTDTDKLSEAQVKMIKAHLALVLERKTAELTPAEVEQRFVDGLKVPKGIEIKPNRFDLPDLSKRYC